MGSTMGSGYVLVLYFEIQTDLSYGHPLIPNAWIREVSLIILFLSVLVVEVNGPDEVVEGSEVTFAYSYRGVDGIATSVSAVVGVTLILETANSENIATM